MTARSATTAAPIANSIACLHCGDPHTRRFFSLHGIPLQARRPRESRFEAREVERVDIRLSVCTHCGMVVDESHEASRLPDGCGCDESHGYTERFDRFTRELIAELGSRHQLAGKHVVEIGCGQGDFLRRLCAATGATGRGFDPAWQPTGGAPSAQCEFVAGEFDAAQQLADAELVICRHTLDHVTSGRALLRTVGAAMRHASRGARLAIEVPDTGRTFALGAFWAIDADARSYYTEAALRTALARTGFTVVGSRRVFDEQYLIVEAVVRAGDAAPKVAIDGGVVWKQVVEFGRQANRTILEWRRRIACAIASDRTVALWGSGSRAVTFLAATELDEEIETVVDVNPHRQGRFVPGTGHEIHAPSILIERRPDLVIATNSAYLDEIRADLAAMGLSPELVALG